MKDQRFTKELTPEQDAEITALRAQFKDLHDKLNELDAAVLALGNKLGKPDIFNGTDYYLLDVLRQLGKGQQCLIYECQQAGYPVYVTGGKDAG